MREGDRQPKVLYELLLLIQNYVRRGRDTLVRNLRNAERRGRAFYAILHTFVLVRAGVRVRACIGTRRDRQNATFGRIGTCLRLFIGAVARTFAAFAYALTVRAVFHRAHQVITTRPHCRQTRLGKLKRYACTTVIENGSIGAVSFKGDRAVKGGIDFVFDVLTPLDRGIGIHIR